MVAAASQMLPPSLEGLDSLNACRITASELSNGESHNEMKLGWSNTVGATILGSGIM